METAQPIVSACCMCRRVRFGTEWVTVPDRILRRLQLSHGFCPACLPKALQKAMASLPGPLALQPDHAPVVA